MLCTHVCLQGKGDISCKNGLKEDVQTAIDMFCTQSLSAARPKHSLISIQIARLIAHKSTEERVLVMLVPLLTVAK